MGKTVKPLVDGIATIEDEELYGLMSGLMDTEDIFIEPSACAAFAVLKRHAELRRYMQDEGLLQRMHSGTHIAWATGGSLVPQETRSAYLRRAEKNA